MSVLIKGISSMKAKFAIKSVYPEDYEDINFEEENIKQMRDRHKKEIEELQTSCKHERISDWLDYMWAPGHFMGKKKHCLTCDKVMESK